MKVIYVQLYFSLKNESLEMDWVNVWKALKIKYGGIRRLIQMEAT
jgi:hypothetical protein